MEIKIKSKNYSTFEIEDLEEALRKFFPDEAASNIFGMTHREWEEDGQRFSAWTFKTENGTLMTGDGGAQLIMESIDKKFKNFISDDSSI